MRARDVGLRLVVVALVLAGAISLFMWMGTLRKPPAQADTGEVRISAEGVRVEPEDVQVVLTGFGTTRSARQVPVSTEVGGRVVEVHPRLEVGEVIAEGELLVAIERDDYEAAVRRLESDIASLQASLEQLAQQRANDERQLEVVRRSRELAGAEYDRYKRLVEVDKVVPPSELDTRERALRQADEQVIMIENTRALYPTRIRQTEAGLASARAQLQTARLDLERTRIAAPITGRIVQKNVERGQIVAPGQALVTLADDSRLEIPVPLEGPEVARWLGVAPGGSDSHWFENFPRREVTVRWSENPGAGRWQGVISRAERYDEQTRTLTLVASVDPPSSQTASRPNFPLVEGMFCEVAIPGLTVEDAYRLPRTAVGHDATVLTVNDGRIASREVEIARVQGDEALITGGLEPGMVVLTSRPGVSLDGTRVDVTFPEDPLATPGATPSGEALR